MVSLKNNLVVVMPGRFQPMHLGHVYMYDHLCEKFGKNNVWIATSNRINENSPLNFKQKASLASVGFGIPKSRVVECKVPYKPIEILQKFNGKKISLVLALGEKDQNRLQEGNYFTLLTENSDNLEHAKKKAYIYATPMFANRRNATNIRKQFKSKISESQKKFLFKKLFGHFDQEIYDTLTK